MNALEVIGMGVQTDTLRTVTVKTEAMRGMEDQEEVVTGMEVVEDHHVTREEAIGIGRLLMTALGGEAAAHHRLIATENFVLFFVAVLLTFVMFVCILWVLDF